MKKIVALQHSLGMDRQAICMYVVDFCFICLDSEYKQRCCEGDSSVPPEMEPEALAFEVATLVHGVTDDAAALFTYILADPHALNSSKWKGCMGCRMDVISSAVKLIGQQVGHRLGRTLAVFLQMMLQKERLKVRHQCCPPSCPQPQPPHPSCPQPQPPHQFRTNEFHAHTCSSSPQYQSMNLCGLRNKYSDSLVSFASL
jgi:hypothetical protein